MTKHLALLALTLVMLLAASPSAEPWQPFEEALATAQADDKKVLVFVEAPWCGWCRKLEKTVFDDAETMATLAAHFTFARLNLDDNEQTHRFKGYRLTSMALAHHLGAETTPTTIFLAPDGEVLTTLATYVEPGEYVKILRYIGTDAYLSQSFEEFNRP